MLKREKEKRPLDRYTGIQYNVIIFKKKGCKKK